MFALGYRQRLIERRRILIFPVDINLGPGIRDTRKNPGGFGGGANTAAFTGGAPICDA